MSHLSVTTRVSKLSRLDISFWNTTCYKPSLCCILVKGPFALWINNSLCEGFYLTVDFASSHFILFNTTCSLEGFETSRYSLFLGWQADWGASALVFTGQEYCTVWLYMDKMCVRSTGGNAMIGDASFWEASYSLPWWWRWRGEGWGWPENMIPRALLSEQCRNCQLVCIALRGPPDLLPTAPKVKKIPSLVTRRDRAWQECQLIKSE